MIWNLDTKIIISSANMNFYLHVCVQCALCVRHSGLIWFISLDKIVLDGCNMTTWTVQQNIFSFSDHPPQQDRFEVSVLQNDGGHTWCCFEWQGHPAARHLDLLTQRARGAALWLATGSWRNLQRLIPGESAAPPQALGERATICKGM